VTSASRLCHCDLNDLW